MAAPPNWDVITPRIVVGSCPHTRDDIHVISDDAECNALLSLQSDADHEHLGIDWYDIASHAEDLGLAVQRIPMRDFDDADIEKSLAEAVHALAMLLDDDRKVYVHCTAGMNRAPLVVLGYLTFCEGKTLKEAVSLVQRRAVAAPPLASWKTVRRELLKRHEERRDRLVEEMSETSDAPRHDLVSRAERLILAGIFRPSKAAR